MRDIYEAMVATAPQEVEATELQDDREVLRVLRQAVIAELDAANLYQQVADSLPNELRNIAELFNHVAEEELVHVGEFTRAIELLSKEDIASYEDGEKEVEETL